MKAIVWFTFFSLTMSLVSCSTGGFRSDDGRAEAVSAPGTLMGKAYRVITESGSGVFSSTGTFTVVFLSSEPWYTTQSDGVHSGGSWGTYIYSSSGASGTVKADDSSLSKVVFSLAFDTASSGTLVATSIADVNSMLSGTFTEL